MNSPAESVNRVRAALEAYVDPYLGETLGAAQAVREVVAAGTGFTARIVLGFPVGGYQAELTAALDRQLAAAGVAAPLTVELRAQIRAHAVQRNLKPLGEISNVVAVASGKGGVGKSTVAVNLALAWAAQGARVGILDADIYGPSQPLMLGLAGQRPASPDGKHLRPLVSHGVARHVDRLPGRCRAADGVARPDGDAGAHAAARARRNGARSITWWSTCRPAPATSSSRSRSACRSPAP